MNTQLLTFLKLNHSIDGTIKVDRSSDILGETAKRINEHQSADMEIVANQLFTSDDFKKIAKSLATRNRVSTVSSILELEKLSEFYLIVLIESLLKAEL